jgi:hypothetical protein
LEELDAEDEEAEEDAEEEDDEEDAEEAAAAADGAEQAVFNALAEKKQAWPHLVGLLFTVGTFQPLDPEVTGKCPTYYLKDNSEILKLTLYKTD